MPIYEYRCEQGHTFEVMQRMSDDPVTSCSTCEANVQRVLHPVAVHFKGSGFYTTDYAKKGRSSSDTGPAGDSSESKSNGSAPSGKGEGKKDSKQSSGAASGASSD